MRDLTGKVAVVTGATFGIGAEVARRLASLGARVWIVGRDADRARALTATLAPPASGTHQACLGDLSLMRETRRIAGVIGDQEPVVDLLINNAGAVFAERRVTPEGLERTFALNHMSYFVLTLALLDRLKAAEQGRIVITSSKMHEMGGPDLSDLQMQKGYDGYKAYGRSKACNIMFARALARRLNGSPVTANAVHPGFVATGFGDANDTFMGKAFNLAKVFALSPEAGARTTLHVALSDEGSRANGAYFVKSRQTEPSAAARDDRAGELLWQISEELSGG